MESIAPKIGCIPQTLLEWVKREEVDGGKRDGLTTSERDRLKQLERENKRLEASRRYSNKSKKELTARIVELEATIDRERKERAAMEEALTQVYSQTMRDMVAQQEAALSEAEKRPERSRWLKNSQPVKEKEKPLPR